MAVFASSMVIRRQGHPVHSSSSNHLLLFADQVGVTRVSTKAKLPLIRITSTDQAGAPNMSESSLHVSMGLTMT